MWFVWGEERCIDGFVGKDKGKNSIKMRLQGIGLGGGGVGGFI
jgi:hypothetical protein